MRLVGILLFFVLAYFGVQLALSILPQLAVLAIVALALRWLWRRR